SVSDIDRNKVMDSVENAFNPETSGIFDVEYSLKSKVSQQQQWVKAKGQVFFDSDGQAYRFIGTALDISVQKRAEKELKFSLERFKLLADSMPQHIWVSDAEGKIEYVNEAVYEQYGSEPEEMMKDGGIYVVHPEARANHISLWNESMKSGKTFSIEHRLLRKDGEYRWMQTKAIP